VTVGIKGVVTAQARVRVTLKDDGGAYTDVGELTDGATAYMLTPDGIHAGNYGAELGKAAWTKLVLTGAA